MNKDNFNNIHHRYLFIKQSWITITRGFMGQIVISTFVCKDKLIHICANKKKYE